MADANRQGFLGAEFEAALNTAVVAVVGLSGGGSHVVQQLAHVGLLNYRLFDSKLFESKHLHRLVGGRASDLRKTTYKTSIAERTIRDVRPKAEVYPVQDRWQERPEVLRGADLAFGCVDSFKERLELEVACRRHLIPYIDIGMTVMERVGQTPRILGQIALSLPGHPCLECLHVVEASNLRREHEDYGMAGPAAQVVFANGALASTAVGFGVQLLSGWRGDELPHLVVRYDGNLDALTPCPTASVARRLICGHFPLGDVGEPRQASLSL